MVERLSTHLVFSLLSRQVVDNQKEIIDLSKKINEGKKFTNSYDDPVSLIGAIETDGRLLENNQGIRSRNNAIAELEASEVSLRTMNDIMNRVKEIAIRASNGSTSADERILFKNELRTLGESVVQLANSKHGDKYIFSGQQSDLQTVRLTNGAPFSSAIYKHNQDNGKERNIDGLQTSTNIQDTLIGEAQSAQLQSSVINPVTTVNGNLVFTVNDGNGTVTNFTAAITAGDDLSAVITKINTAFTTAGGLGAIAQESPSGYLNMDTSLITGNTASSLAQISLDKTSTTALTNELHIKKQDYYGKEIGILRTLASLETALGANDDTTIRNLLDGVEFNLAQLNSSISNVGLLISQAERFNSTAEDLDIKLQTDLSAIQDLDMIEANVKLSNAQVALQTAVRTSSNFFNYSLVNFLG